MRDVSINDDKRLLTPSLDQILVSDSTLTVKDEKNVPEIILETESSTKSIIHCKIAEISEEKA